MTQSERAHVTWTNWAGNVRAPAKALHVAPDEAAVISAIGAARDARMCVRPGGTGHSFAPLCYTDGALLTLAASAEPPLQTTEGSFCMWAGLPIDAIGAPLWAAGRSLGNQGDIDVQRIGGAIATGTHGTGRQFRSISSDVRSLRMVDCNGAIIEVDRERDPLLWSAAALSVGSLGVVTHVQLETVPRYFLAVRTLLCDFSTCLETLADMEAEHRNVEIYWLPRFDRCVVKTFDLVTAQMLSEASGPLPPPGTLERYLRPEYADRAYKVYPSVRTVPFVEMEVAVAEEAGRECLREIRQLIKQRHATLEWDVEYRTQAADELLLSPCYRRAGACISIHQSVGGDYHSLFADCASVFRTFAGRPHWGKLSCLSPRDYEDAFPGLAAFGAIRTRVDPQGLFLNDHLRAIFT